MTEALITTDKEGKITIFNKNAENLFSSAERDVIGTNFIEVLGERFQFINEILKGKEDLLNVEIEYKHAGGSNKILLVSTTKAFDQKGGIDSFTIVFRDITDIQRDGASGSAA